VEDKTSIYKVVGWKWQVEPAKSELSASDADRMVAAVAVDDDTQVADFALEVKWSGTYTEIPTDQNVPPGWRTQLETWMLAVGDYNPGCQSLFFYQTTDPWDTSGSEGIRVIIDAEDDSSDGHGLDPGDSLTFAGTDQTDLDDGSGELENYGSETHDIIPVCGEEAQSAAPAIGNFGLAVLVVLIVVAGATALRWRSVVRTA
jgi:hypothetical protein